MYFLKLYKVCYCVTADNYIVAELLINVHNTFLGIVKNSFVIFDIIMLNSPSIKPKEIFL